MSFATRGWLFASRSMDLLRSEIDRAPAFGINQIQLSHSIVHYAEQIIDEPDRRKDVAELIERANDRGIEVLVWAHELQNLPTHLFVGGKVDLNSRRTWDFVAERYERLFELLPNLGGIVLTVTETRIRMEDDNEVISNRTPQHRVARAVSMVERICRAHDARLVVRSFTWAPRTLIWYVDAMREVPEGVAVMTKESWGDWFQYSPPNPFLGLFGTRSQMMELDCWGEYAGGTRIPWDSSDYLRLRMRQARDLGVSGVVARVDRAEKSTFGTLNEFNTVAFSRLAANPDADIDSIRREWVAERYGLDAADAVLDAMAKTNEIVQRTYFTRGIKGVTTNSPTLVEAEAESTLRFWRDFHGQWAPEMATRAAALLEPTSETVVSLVSEKDRAVSLCDQALASIESAKEHLAPYDYQALNAGFDHARTLAVAWRAMTQVVYLHKLLERDPSPAYRDWFRVAGEELLAAAHDIERRHGKGFALAHPAALGNLWHAAEAVHGEDVAWSRPLGLYVASTPAVAAAGPGGRGLTTYAVSSHREIAALGPDGERCWTVHSRGERYEYPHFSSPLVLGEESEGRLILVGAADGRLYALGGDGRIVWEYATGNRIDAAPAAADIDGDGRIEIIVASRDGTLTCLGTAGEKRWSIDFTEPIFATPAVTPTREIVVATLEGSIACVSGHGDIRWREMLIAPEIEHHAYHGVPDGRQYVLNEGGGAAIYASPLITDLTGDGEIDIVVGVVTGRLHVFDMHGSLEWEAAAAGPIYSSPCAVDRGEGDVRVIFGSDDGKVHAVDSAGTTVWLFETGGSVRSSPVVVPARVAGRECVVVGSNDHRVYVLDAEGEELDEYVTGGPIFGAPLVADVNGDGLAEIVVGSYDHRIHAFRTSWPVRPGEVVVGSFRGGPLRQGI